MKNKIGLGLITYNSPDRLKKSAFTVPNIDLFVIVNDTGITTPEFLKYSNDCYPKHAIVINNQKNLGVGCAKNVALRYLLHNGCDHLFLMEDDILIKNPNVFIEYIKHAEVSGLWHLMFGYHGPANRHPKDYSKLTPKRIVEYSENISIAFNHHCVGAFCYYYKGIIRNIGYIDEVYKNAWEHIDHSYRIVKAGLLPAYWWWPDIEKSCDYLDEINSSEQQSVIRKTDEWKLNLIKGAEYFKHLHGYYPTTVPDTKEDEILKKLEDIQKKYSKKIL